MRVAVWGLQPDLDWKMPMREEVVSPRLASAARTCNTSSSLAGKIHPNRIELNDGGEHRRRRGGSDELADLTTFRAETTPSNGAVTSV